MVAVLSAFTAARRGLLRGALGGAEGGFGGLFGGDEGENGLLLGGGEAKQDCVALGDALGHLGRSRSGLGVEHGGREDGEDREDGGGQQEVCFMGSPGRY